METFKREIFERLGNLFYSLAAEQHMALITSGDLKMAVRKDWLGLCYLLYKCVTFRAV